MASNEELYNALVLLHNECGLSDCEDCDIYKMIGLDKCPFNMVEHWEIKKPRRFTDTDILWAKAAKASGANWIYFDGALCSECGVKYAYTDKEKSAAGTICFPDSAFQPLNIGETVLIDDILKEENRADCKE